MNLFKRLMCYSRRHSPWLFHMNSGSCNGCDIELVASLTPRYDAEQLGVRLEGSPRHADILCITGPVTKNAVNAIRTVYGQVCGPKAVVAIGSCPATTNVFIDSRTLDGPLDKHIPVDVFVPGCPPRPDAINIATALARLLIFPGLLFAVPAAWFFLWVERKAVALMQDRVGPPFMQPFFDFVKLLGKSTPPRVGIAGALMKAWPLIAVSAAAGAVGLLPVLPSSGGFEGDLILLLALLELPSMCIIAAGFSSRSIFGEIGSAREAALSVSYNIVFLLAIVSIAASQHTFRLEALAALPYSPMRLLGIAAILVCLPAKLHLNPFSLPNAEQEIYSGPMTEYAGPELAMWELSHGLEWVAATGLVATFVAPHVTLWWLAAFLFVALSFAIVLLLSTLAAATARLAIDTTVRFYWQCTLIFAVLAISSALLMRFRS